MGSGWDGALDRLLRSDVGELVPLTDDAHHPHAMRMWIGACARTVASRGTRRGSGVAARTTGSGARSPMDESYRFRSSSSILEMALGHTSGSTRSVAVFIVR